MCHSEVAALDVFNALSVGSGLYMLAIHPRSRKALMNSATDALSKCGHRIAARTG